VSQRVSVAARSSRKCQERLGTARNTARSSREGGEQPGAAAAGASLGLEATKGDITRERGLGAGGIGGKGKGV
jgi:hypothetical protein